MQLRIKTEPAVEPVTVSEVKEHLRIDSGTFADNISGSPSINMASYSAGTSTGSGIDVLGYNVVFNLTPGTVPAGATVTAHLEESDDDTTYTDVVGSTFTASTANQNTVIEEAYTGTKQYVRAVATVAGDDVVYGINAMKYAPTSAEDSYIDGLITIARQIVEEYLKRALITQTWYYHLNNWPEDDFIYLPLGKLQSVTSVTYLDTDGDSSTFSSDDYIVDTYSNLGRVVLGYGETWPSATLYPSNPITVEFVCGYGDVASDIPKAIRQAVLLIAGELYERRENTDVKQMYTVPVCAERLLYPYRLWLPEQDGGL